MGRCQSVGVCGLVCHIKKSYMTIDLYVKLWYTYRIERGVEKMDFFGRCLVACAVCYLIIHVIVALYIR